MVILHNRSLFVSRPFRDRSVFTGREISVLSHFPPHHLQKCSKCIVGGGKMGKYRNIISTKYGYDVSFDFTKNRLVAQ